MALQYKYNSISGTTLQTKYIKWHYNANQIQQMTLQWKWNTPNCTTMQRRKKEKKNLLHPKLSLWFGSSHERMRRRKNRFLLTNAPRKASSRKEQFKLLVARQKGRLAMQGSAALLSTPASTNTGRENRAGIATWSVCDRLTCPIYLLRK